MTTTETVNVRQFCRLNNISCSSRSADRNPHMESSRDMNHYKSTLRFGRKRMTVYFSMGLGLSGEPQAEDVLDCLSSDAAGVANAQDFADWCTEYGYDEDSRKAERTYNLLLREAAKLEKFLGAGLYSKLLYETESL